MIFLPYFLGKELEETLGHQTSGLLDYLELDSFAASCILLHKLNSSSNRRNFFTFLPSYEYTFKLIARGI